MNQLYNSYVQNGVIAKPNVIYHGDHLSMQYNGLLYQGGAKEVFAHIGYEKGWDASEDIKMKQAQEGFEISFPIKEYNQLNVAFHDSANNWDNNSGKDYSFNIQPKKLME